MGERSDPPDSRSDEANALGSMILGRYGSSPGLIDVQAPQRLFDRFSAFGENRHPMLTAHNERYATRTQDAGSSSLPLFRSAGWRLRLRRPRHSGAAFADAEAMSHPFAEGSMEKPPVHRESLYAAHIQRLFEGAATATYDPSPTFRFEDASAFMHALPVRQAVLMSHHGALQNIMRNVLVRQRRERASESFDTSTAIRPFVTGSSVIRRQYLSLPNHPESSPDWPWESDAGPADALNSSPSRDFFAPAGKSDVGAMGYTPAEGRRFFNLQQSYSPFLARSAAQTTGSSALLHSMQSRPVVSPRLWRTRQAASEPHLIKGDAGYVPASAAHVHTSGVFPLKNMPLDGTAMYRQRTSESPMPASEAPLLLRSRTASWEAVLLAAARPQRQSITGGDTDPGLEWPAVRSATDRQDSSSVSAEALGLRTTAGPIGGVSHSGIPSLGLYGHPSQHRPIPGQTPHAGTSDTSIALIQRREGTAAVALGKASRGSLSDVATSDTSGGEEHLAFQKQQMERIQHTSGSGPERHGTWSQQSPILRQIQSTNQFVATTGPRIPAAGSPTAAAPDIAKPLWHRAAGVDAPGTVSRRRLSGGPTSDMSGGEERWISQRQRAEQAQHSAGHTPVHDEVSLQWSPILRQIRSTQGFPATIEPRIPAAGLRAGAREQASDSIAGTDHLSSSQGAGELGTSQLHITSRCGAYPDAYRSAGFGLKPSESRVLRQARETLQLHASKPSRTSADWGSAFAYAHLLHAPEASQDTGRTQLARVADAPRGENPSHQLLLSGNLTGLQRRQTAEWRQRWPVPIPAGTVLAARLTDTSVATPAWPFLLAAPVNLVDRAPAKLPGTSSAGTHADGTLTDDGAVADESRTAVVAGDLTRQLADIGRAMFRRAAMPGLGHSPGSSAQSMREASAGIPAMSLLIAGQTPTLSAASVFRQPRIFRLQSSAPEAIASAYRVLPARTAAGIAFRPPDTATLSQHWLDRENHPAVNQTAAHPMLDFAASNWNVNLLRPAARITRATSPGALSDRSLSLSNSAQDGGSMTLHARRGTISASAESGTADGRPGRTLEAAGSATAGSHRFAASVEVFGSDSAGMIARAPFSPATSAAGGGDFLPTMGFIDALRRPLSFGVLPIRRTVGNSSGEPGATLGDAALLSGIPSATRSAGAVQFDSLPLAGRFSVPRPAASGLSSATVNREAVTGGAVAVARAAPALVDQTRDLSVALNPEQSGPAMNAASARPAQGEQAAGVDIEDLIDRVSRRLFRELDVERERQGITRWR